MRLVGAWSFVTLRDVVGRLVSGMTGRGRVWWGLLLVLAGCRGEGAESLGQLPPLPRLAAPEEPAGPASSFGPAVDRILLPEVKRGASAAEVLDVLPSLQAVGSKPAVAQAEPRTPAGARPRSAKKLPALGGTRAATPSRRAPALTGWGPEGTLDHQAHIRLAFSQPMVDLAQNRRDLPVRISPETPGRWRWIGTRLAVFEPDAPLPADTQYTVEVPTSLLSAAGRRLRRGVRFSFRTAPAVFQSFRQLHPVPNATEGAMFLVSLAGPVVDQAIFDSIEMVAETTGKAASLELMSDAEVDALVHGEARYRGAEHSVGFRATDLEPATRYQIRIGKAYVYSRYGRPPAAWVGRYDTHYPLRVRVGFDARQQKAGVHFSNPVPPEAVELVTVSPSPPDLEIVANGSSLTLSGSFEARATYQVSVAPSLRDVYGQALASAPELSFRAAERPDDRPPPAFAVPTGMVVADPLGGPPRLDAHARGGDVLLVHMWRATPADFEAFSEGRPPEGKPIRRTVKVPGGPKEQVVVPIALGPALRRGRGHMVARVVPARWSRERIERAPLTWVQATRLAVDVDDSDGEIRVRTSDLLTGAPRPGVALSGAVSATTDADGLAVVPWADLGPGNRRVPVVATAEGDSALVERGRWTDGGHAPGGWFMTDPAGVYRPGETVRIKGWVRNADREIPDPGQHEVRYRAVFEAGGRVARSRLPVREGVASLTPLGGFDIEVPLPEDQEGALQVHTRLVRIEDEDSKQQSWSSYRVRVARYRPPAFELRVQSGELFHRVGAPVSLRTRAAHFGGGPAADVSLTWQVRAYEARFEPKQHPGYLFGEAEALFWDWNPWFLEPEPVQVWERSSTTDVDGGSAIEIATDLLASGKSFRLEVSVRGQGATGLGAQETSRLLLHPGAALIGLRTDTPYFRPGQPARLSGVVVDPAGTALSGRPWSVRVEREDWRRRDENGDVIVDVVARCEGSTGGDPFACETPPLAPGHHRAVATTTDADGASHASVLEFYVFGGPRPDQRLSRGSLVLVPDKPRYDVGDVAVVHVAAPFARGQGWLSIVAEGGTRMESFVLHDGRAVIEIPIVEAHVPDLRLQVDVAGAEGRGGLIGWAFPRPALASGATALRISRATRRLDVQVDVARDVLRPGQTQRAMVAVHDADGQPVAGAEVALMVVDDAVIELDQRTSVDPVEILYPRWRRSRSTTMHFREYVRLFDSLAPTALVDSWSAATAGVAASQISSLDFQPAVAQVEAAPYEVVAAFQPTLTTDGRGRVSVPFSLPGQEGRFRVTAMVAGDARRFGVGERKFAVRMPLSVHPVGPAFANTGDEFALTVHVNNPGDEPVDVDLALDCNGAVELASERATATVPATSSSVISIPAVAKEAGRARVRVVAVAGESADAAQLTIPIRDPAIVETHTASGLLGRGALMQRLRVPDIVPGLGRLRVRVEATGLEGVRPHVARVLARIDDAPSPATAIFVDAARLRLQSLPGDEVARLRARIATNVEAIGATWKRDRSGHGRFGFGEAAVHMVHALHVAREVGISLPPIVVERAIAELDRFAYVSKGQQTIPERQAYALYVRRLFGLPNDELLKSLLRIDPKLAGGETAVAGYMLAGLHGLRRYQRERTLLIRRLEDRAVRTATDVNWPPVTHSYLTRWRTARGVNTPVALLGLTLENPTHPLVEPGVRGLSSLRDTSALDLALAVFELYAASLPARSPPSRVRVRVGDIVEDSVAFDGSVGEREMVVPMADVRDGTQVWLERVAGRADVRYTIETSYAPREVSAEPFDAGFAVARSYEGVESPEDVTRLADGTWQIRQGALVRVRVRAFSLVRRAGVRINDFLPAGLEPVNGGLDFSGAWTKSSAWAYRRPGSVQRGRIRTDVGELRAQGTQITVLTRAVTPGLYLAAPAQALETGRPEIQGHSGVARVRVAAR